jgi:hypothetical protein
VEGSVLLTADRIDVVAGEGVHAVLIVSTPMVVVRALGGVDRLRRQLEDVGFHDVRVFLDRPPTWRSPSNVPRPGDLEWSLFAEFVPNRTASLRRALTEELRVADAWDARTDGVASLPIFHPYAVCECAAARFSGATKAFATAYPIEVF